MAAFEILATYYIALASCLSFLTALLLSLGSKRGAWHSGIACSSLFTLFYGFLATASFSSIAEGYYGNSVLLLLSLVIVVLNVVSVFGLDSFTKNKST